jgi:4-carboxymuconolactone decarboxylase
VTADGPRIPPLATEEWGEDAVAALRAAFGDKAAERLLSDEPGTPPMPNVLTTLLRHPALAGPLLVYNGVLLQTPTIAPRLRELMILRVAWRTGSTYEWAQHVALAPRFEITPEDIDAVAHGVGAGWSPLEADLLAATDQLIDRYRIEDETWNRLAEQLDERQLMEITFVVGTYTCLAMAFNTFGIELDPGLDVSMAPPLPQSTA